MIWGKEIKKGLIASGLGLSIVELGEEYTEEDILVHDQANRELAWHLAHLTKPGDPVPVGVIYRVERPTYDSGVHTQVNQATQKLGRGDVARLIGKADTWKIG